MFSKRSTGHSSEGTHLSKHFSTHSAKGSSMSEHFSTYSAKGSPMSEHFSTHSSKGCSVSAHFSTYSAKGPFVSAHVFPDTPQKNFPQQTISSVTPQKGLPCHTTFPVTPQNDLPSSSSSPVTPQKELPGQSIFPVTPLKEFTTQSMFPVANQQTTISSVSAQMSVWPSTMSGVFKSPLSLVSTAQLSSGLPSVDQWYRVPMPSSSADCNNQNNLTNSNSVKSLQSTLNLSFFQPLPPIGADLPTSVGTSVRPSVFQQSLANLGLNPLVNLESNEVKKLLEASQKFCNTMQPSFVNNPQTAMSAIELEIKKIKDKELSDNATGKITSWAELLTSEKILKLQEQQIKQLEEQLRQSREQLVKTHSETWQQHRNLESEMSAAYTSLVRSRRLALSTCSTVPTTGSHFMASFLSAGRSMNPVNSVHSQPSEEQTFDNSRQDCDKKPDSEFLGNDVDDIFKMTSSLEEALGDAMEDDADGGGGCGSYFTGELDHSCLDIYSMNKSVDM